MNDELDIDLRRSLRTAAAPLDADAADRIWHDIEAALRSPASADGAAIDLLDVDRVGHATPQRTGHRAVVGWLAVAAAVVTVLVGVTAWRSGGEGGIGEVPATTTPTQVQYGEIPPLDDASIFHLPDPMPDGWHVSQVLHGVDFPMDWVEKGGSLETEPPIPDGTFRSFSVFLYRDDGRAFAHLDVVETPVRNADRAPERGTTDASADDLAAAGLTTTAGWGWTLGGRKMGLTIVGDESLGEPLLDAIRPVAAATVVRAVADGQAAAQAMPVLETVDMPGRGTLTARGPGDHVITVCAEATISTCAFVSTFFGLEDVALGWAGTEAGGFSYGWVDGDFVTDVERDESRRAMPRTDLVGMPRLATLDADTGFTPITPGVSDVPVVDGAALGRIEAVEDMSVFYLPWPAPAGWYVARVRPVIETEYDGRTGDFVLPPRPALADDRQRSFQVDLVSDSGSAATLSVDERPRPLTASDIALSGIRDDIARREVRVADVSQVVSPNPFEVERRRWTWVLDERILVLDGDLDDDEAAALIRSIVKVRGGYVVGAVRQGQAAAVRLPVIAEAEIDGIRLTAHGADGRVLFLCADGAGPIACGSGLTQWDFPGVAQVRVTGARETPLLAAWVPAELDAEVLDTFVPQLGPVAPTVVDAGSGLFVVLPDSGLGIDSPRWSGAEFVMPDADLIGMPRVAVTPEPETPGLEVPSD